MASRFIRFIRRNSAVTEIAIAVLVVLAGKLADVLGENKGRRQ